jgi:hypothetical protein
MILNSPTSRKITDLIEELQEPFSQIDFSSLIEEMRVLSSKTDLDYITKESIKQDMEFVRLAQDAFGELLFPGEKMIDHLEEIRPEVEHRKDKDLTGRWGSLPLVLDRWLEALWAIDSSNGSALLELTLAPSILPGEEEEGMTEDKSKRIIHLPVLIMNNGTGPALDVRLEIKKNDNYTLLEAKIGSTTCTPSDGKLKLGVLNRNSWRLITFKLSQDTDCELNLEISGTYSDYTKNTKDNPLKPVRFVWPRFVHPVGSSIEVDEKNIPISNPFVIGRPVAMKSELQTVFRGHSDHLKRLEDLVNQEKGTLIFLKGLRRVGKTSLILQLREKIKDKFPVVYVDCDLLERHITLTNTQWGESDFWYEIALIVAAAGNLPKLSERFDPDPTQAYVQFKNFLLSIKKRVLLVFDETDEFGKGKFTSFAKQVVDVLADLRRQGISSIFIHEVTDGFWERLEDGYESIRIEFLDQQEMERLASVELVPANKVAELQGKQLPRLTFTPLALAYLWQVTGGYPFITQLICHHLVESKISSLRKPEDQFNAVIEIKDIKYIVQQILLSMDDRPQIEYLSLGFTPEEKKSLVDIGRPRTSGRRDIEPRYGLLKPIVLAKDGVSMQIRDRYQCDPDDYNRFQTRYNPLPQDALKRLLEKKVIDTLSVAGKGTNLRLRVGFLWLYLNSVLRPEDDEGRSDQLREEQQAIQVAATKALATLRQVG